MNLITLIIIIFLMNLEQTHSKTSNNLPEGFVYLSNYNPNIIQNLRYFSRNNFTGRKVFMYQGSSVICTKQAAQALAKIQIQLEQLGYRLVIYDAYRPASATKSFVDWAANSTDINQTSKKLYYPYIQKNRIIPEGFVAEKSGHNRGSTIDLTIIKIGSQLMPISQKQVIMNDGTVLWVPFDNTVDMGTGFDLFHEASHHGSKLISEDATNRREMLRQIMESNGFKKYEYQWWHYTLKNQPFPDTYFDFPVQEPQYLQ